MTYRERKKKDVLVALTSLMETPSFHNIFLLTFRKKKKTQKFCANMY